MVLSKENNPERMTEDTKKLVKDVFGENYQNAIKNT